MSKASVAPDSRLVLDLISAGRAAVENMQGFVRLVDETLTESHARNLKREFRNELVAARTRMEESAIALVRELDRTLTGIDPPLVELEVRKTKRVVRLLKETAFWAAVVGGTLGGVGQGITTEAIDRMAGNVAEVETQLDSVETACSSFTQTEPHGDADHQDRTDSSRSNQLDPASDQDDGNDPTSKATRPDADNTDASPAETPPDPVEYDNEAHLGDAVDLAHRVATALGANDAEAEEVAQVTALKLWQQRNRQPVAELQGGSEQWRDLVTRSARSTHYDLIRSRERRIRRERQSVNLPLEDDPSSRPPQTWATTDSNIESWLARAALADYVNRLPRPQRDVAVRRFVMEMSVDEVAAELGIARQTVRSRSRRARDTLRAMIEAESEGES